MNKNAIMGVIALVVIVVGLILFLPRAERTTIRTNPVNAVPQVDQRDLAIAQLQGEINNLSFRLQECENRALSSASNVGSGTNLGGNTGMGSGSLSMSGPIEMQVSGDMKVSGKLTLTPTGTAQAPKTVQRATPAPKPVTQKVVTPAPQPPPTQTVVVQAPSRQATQGRVLPSYYYGGPDEDRVTYCLMFGDNENRHLPALKPTAFDPDIIKPNHLPGGGSNFYTYPTKGFVGALGVTDQGVFFFSEKVIEDFMIASDNGLVQIKAPATGWNPATLLYRGDGYYTWSPN